MKTTIAVLLVLLLASCAKDDRSIQYEVSCYTCSARYLDADGNSNYIKIVPDTTFTEQGDTIINPGPYTWSTSFEIHPDAEIFFGVSRLSVNGVTTIASRTIDGKKETKSTGPERAVLEFH